MTVVKKQKIITKWQNCNKKRLIDKGYKFTYLNDELEINVEDLSPGSQVYVKFVCDICNGENQILDKHKTRMYRNLNRNKKDGLKDYCIICAAGSAYKNVKFEKSLTFTNPKVASEWNYERNIGNPESVMGRSGKMVWWKCEKGHEWESKICNRTSTNSNCPYCGNKKLCQDNSLLYVSPELSKEWHPNKNGDLKPEDIIYATKKKYWWICSEDHEFYISPTLRFNRGTGCPTCNESKGEKLIRELLTSLKINFSAQFEFKDLLGVGGKNLKFDFVIYDENQSILCLVEYDGIFHFEKQYKNDGYENLIKHDEFKNQYCNKNGFPLLRIPYWDFDKIEEILLKELKKYKLV